MRASPTTEPARWHGLGFSFAGALCSAAYLFPYKRASHFAPPEALAFALLLVAALLNSALIGLQRPRPTGSPRPARRVLWTTSAGLALATVSGNFCGAHAVALLDPAICSVLLRLEVVYVGVLGVVLLGERFTLALVLGACTALGGLVVMRWPLHISATESGPLWALGAAASFGFMQVFTRRFIARISPVSVNALRLWIAALAMAFWPGTLTTVLEAGLGFWGNIALAGLFGPFLGRLFIMYSLRTLRAAHSALLLLVAPVLAFAFGYVMTGVTPTPRELAGGALMLVGIALPSLEGLGSRATLVA